MRILFISGAGFGGSFLSTKALARVLVRQGHSVGLLHQLSDHPRTLWLHKRLENLQARAKGTSIQGIAEQFARRPGCRPVSTATEEPYPVWGTTVPANALGALIKQFSPDVVVTASVLRPQWRQILADLRSQRIPSVLYLRESVSLTHLTVSKAHPDLLLANSVSLAEVAEKAGCPAVMIPSVVDLESSRKVSTRERVLVVNPLQSYGGVLAFELAARCPEIPFVMQESWHGGSAQVPLDRPGEPLPNVEYRGFVNRAGDIYRDAKVLLVPYSRAMANHRPRSVLEAQANGIPVVASNLPGLIESIGDGGLLIDPDGPMEAWTGALRLMWSDHELYNRLSAAARAHASRPEVDPDRVTARFCEAIGTLLLKAKGCGA